MPVYLPKEIWRKLSVEPEDFATTLPQRPERAGGVRNIQGNGLMSDATNRRSETVAIDEVITTVIMARVTDFFGFFVYAIASVLVFPRLFFPMYDSVTATLLSFAVFSIAFLARPLGAILGDALQRRTSAPVRIMAALMVFGSSTVAIGLLPGYDAIGWTAPALLMALRIAQGVGLGGAFDGITLQLQNLAPEGRKGLYGMVPQLGGPIGFCVAASLFYVLVGFLEDDEFIDFGWRFAFFGVMAVNVVSLFARLRLLSAGFGAEIIAPKSAPIIPMIREQWEPIAISAFMPLASYALFHMVTVFPLAYALLYTELDIDYVLLLQFLAGVLGVCATIASGVLSDRFGRPKVLGFCTLAIPLLCLTIPLLPSYPSIYIFAGFILLGLAHGQSSAIAPARFKPEYRYSGAAVSINLSWIVGAAFAPLVGLALTAAFGLEASALYLLSGAVVTGYVLYARYGAAAFKISWASTEEN
ncbi:MAG: MFS transporter [Pseudomonadota bacterium]